jgi:hypothetical protein
LYKRVLINNGIGMHYLIIHLTRNNVRGFIHVST